MPMTKTRKIGIATAAIAVVTLGGVGWAGAATNAHSSGSANKQYQGCVSKSTGALRVVSAHQSCKGSNGPETRITWNEAGVRGATGARGPAGARGATGSAGAKGDTGKAGVDGKDGATGSTGPIGDTGDTGPKGDPGIAGPQGKTGDTGDTGPQGDKGDKGEKGDKGDKGDKGATGSSGSTTYLKALSFDSYNPSLIQTPAFLISGYCSSSGNAVHLLTYDRSDEQPTVLSSNVGNTSGGAGYTDYSTISGQQILSQVQHHDGSNASTFIAIIKKVDSSTCTLVITYSTS